MRSFVLLVALASSVLGYQVTRPNTYSGWTNQGSQTVSWDRVATDPERFALMLTNTNRTLLPDDILIASSVNGAGSSSFTFDPPSGGWPTPGGSYRVNLVRSASEPESILAQSSEFNITDSGATTTSTRSTSSTVRVSGSVTTSPSNSGPAAGTRANSSGTSPEAAESGSGLVPTGSASSLQAIAAPAALTLLAASILL